MPKGLVRRNCGTGKGYSHEYESRIAKYQGGRFRNGSKHKGVSVILENSAARPRAVARQKGTYKKIEGCSHQIGGAQPLHTQILVKKDQFLGNNIEESERQKEHTSHGNLQTRTPHSQHSAEPDFTENSNSPGA